MKRCLHASDLAPRLVLGHGVEIGEGTSLGGCVVMHSGTVIGEGCEIGDGVVLGKLPRLGSRSSAPREEPPPVTLGVGTVVCAGAVVYAGAALGPGVIVGDQAQVRERVTVGADTVIGRGTGVDNDVAIGAQVRIQSNCYLAAHAVIEDMVFIGPGVVLTNDDTIGRRGAGDQLEGPVLRRGCRIGAGAVLTPGVDVGPEAFVAAGAVVTRDVPERAVVMGVPARAVREVADADLLPPPAGSSPSMDPPSPAP